MSKLDLNLVVIFDAIMREKSISAAAVHLSMTQPSVSNAVARMRHSWKDPLFIKQGRGIKPSPFALKLWQQIALPLEQIQSAITPSPFIAAQSQKTFRIATTDGTSALFWPALRRYLEQYAPNINIHAVPYKLDGEALLVNAEVDLVLDYYGNNHPQINSEYLFDNVFVCVMAKDHPLNRGDISLDGFAAAEHLLVSLSGDASGSVDRKLAQLGLTRRISMTVNSFASAQALLEGSQLITSLPYPIVASWHCNERLVVKTLPIELAPVPISMAWHRRDQGAKSLLWLREVLLEIVNSQTHLFNGELKSSSL
jgi:DNA-binding transcriptional LysR family regulator